MILSDNVGTRSLLLSCSSSKRSAQAVPQALDSKGAHTHTLGVTAPCPHSGRSMQPARTQSVSKLPHTQLIRRAPRAPPPPVWAGRHQTTHSLLAAAALASENHSQTLELTLGAHTSTAQLSKERPLHCHNSPRAPHARARCSSAGWVARSRRPRVAPHPATASAHRHQAHKRVCLKGGRSALPVIRLSYV